MAYDWKDITQQQLAGNSNVGMNALSTMQPQQLRTGKNPNPQFPRLRNWWENVKEGLGNAGQGAKEFAFGTPGHLEQTQNFTPQQQGIMQLLQQLGVFGLRDPHAGFEPIEQQARNQFSEQTVPSLAERFTSMGNNSLSSPAFISQLGQAGAGLESDLAAQKAQYGQQNVQQILQMLQLGLQPQFENAYRPRQAGALENIAGAGLNNIGGIWDVIQKSRALKGLTPQQ